MLQKTEKLLRSPRLKQELQFSSSGAPSLCRIPRKSMVGNACWIVKASQNAVLGPGLAENPWKIPGKSLFSLGNLDDSSDWREKSLEMSSCFPHVSRNHGGRATRITERDSCNSTLPSSSVGQQWSSSQAVLDFRKPPCQRWNSYCPQVLPSKHQNRRISQVAKVINNAHWRLMIKSGPLRKLTWKLKKHTCSLMGQPVCVDPIFYRRNSGCPQNHHLSKLKTSSKWFSLAIKST